MCVQTLIRRFSRICMGSHWFQPLTGFGNQYNCFTYTEPLKNHFLRHPLMSLFAKYCTSNVSEPLPPVYEGVDENDKRFTINVLCNRCRA